MKGAKKKITRKPYKAEVIYGKFPAGKQKNDPLIPRN